MCECKTVEMYQNSDTHWTTNLSHYTLWFILHTITSNKTYNSFIIIYKRNEKGYVQYNGQKK